MIEVRTGDLDDKLPQNISCLFFYIKSYLKPSYSSLILLHYFQFKNAFGGNEGSEIQLEKLTNMCFQQEYSVNPNTKSPLVVHALGGIRTRNPRR